MGSTGPHVRFSPVVEEGDDEGDWPPTVCCRRKNGLAGFVLRKCRIRDADRIGSIDELYTCFTSNGIRAKLHGGSHDETDNSYLSPAKITAPSSRASGYFRKA
jgi:hypothetical protein